MNKGKLYFLTFTFTFTGFYRNKNLPAVVKTAAVAHSPPWLIHRRGVILTKPSLPMTAKLFSEPKPKQQVKD